MSMNTSDESPRRAKAKRNLFGRVDHDQIRNDLHRELTLIGEEKKQKWNFDFENCEPLEGRFKWQRVGRRLQTRKSPVEATPCVPSSGTSFAENVFRQRSVESTQARARYNLRTRGKELVNVAGFEFKPIDLSRDRLRDFRPTAGNRNTGNYKSKRITKGRKSTSSTVRRKTKIPHHLVAKKSRR